MKAVVDPVGPHTAKTIIELTKCYKMFEIPSAMVSQLALCRKIVDSFQWVSTALRCPVCSGFRWPPRLAATHFPWLVMERTTPKSSIFVSSVYCLAIAERQVFLLRFSQNFEAAGGLLPETTQPIQEKWQCDQCSRCFPSKRGLASHAARPRLQEVRAVLCHSCHMWRLRKILSRQSTPVMHLYDCLECIRTIQACFPPATEEQVEQLDEEGKQYASQMRQQRWWKTKAFQPPLRIQGPLLPPPDSEDAKAFKAKWDLRNPVPGSSFRELQGRLAVPGQSEEPQVVLLEADMPAFVMHAPPGPNPGGGAYSRNSLAAETARLHIKWLVFVHFFSGFRRTDDLQAVLESTPLENCAQLLVISVDMCMQRKDGNLATDTATSWWLTRVRSGQIVGAGGPPPCETFTAARFLPDGPRPLRTGDHPDGIPGRTGKERMQLRIGSRLVFFIFEILLELAKFGGCGFVEHPQWPIWARRFNPASIWASPQARLCRTLNCFSAVSFDQCIVGSIAKKPTTLQLLRLDSFRHEILATGNWGRCHHIAGTHEQLQGRTEDGEFRTAVGKIYPAGLNQFLGRAVCRYILETFKGELLHSDLPKEFNCFLQQQFEDDGIVQPDYHGLHTWSSPAAAVSIARDQVPMGTADAKWQSVILPIDELIFFKMVKTTNQCI